MNVISLNSTQFGVKKLSFKPVGYRSTIYYIALRALLYYCFFIIFKLRLK